MNTKGTEKACSSQSSISRQPEISDSARLVIAQTTTPPSSKVNHAKVWPGVSTIKRNQSSDLIIPEFADLRIDTKEQNSSQLGKTQGIRHPDSSIATGIHLR
eukprot:IDg14669t1